MSVNSIVVLVSGMDSLVALYKAKNDYPNADVKGVWYDLGLSFSEAEGSRLPDDIDVVEFHGYMDSLHQTDCQGVKIYPLMYEGIVIDAIRRYNPDLLWLGVLATDSELFEDNQIGWANDISEMFRKTKVDFPLARMDLGKEEVIEYGLSIGVPERDIVTTHTCRSKFHGKNGCGSCFSCMRKKCALEKFGFENSIPKPDVLPVKNLALQMTKFAKIMNDGFIGERYHRHMSEILPLLENTYGSFETYDELGKAVSDHYESRCHIIEDLINYGEIDDESDIGK